MVKLLINSTTRNISTWSSTPAKLVTRADGNRVYVSGNSDDRALIQSHLHDLYKASSLEFRPWNGSWDPYYTGSYIVSGVVPPMQVYTRRIEREPVSNVNFSARSRAGEIILAPFRSEFVVELKVTPPVHDTVTAERGHYIDLPRQIGVIRDPLGSAAECFSINGTVYRGGRVLSPHDEVTRIVQDDDTCLYNPDAHLDRIATRWENIHTDVDGLTVQTALASANEGQYAILATLAEIPEGWLQALSGIKSCLKMYKEAREKDVRLTNRLSRLRKIQNPTLAVRQEIKNILDASADVWLTYRLAIAPTVGAISDWLELDTNPDLPLFLRYRETLVGHFDVGYDSVHNVNCVQRAFIKRKYNSFVASLGWGSLSAVWELVPMSFVIDRFIKIGDFITAHTSPNLSVAQGATYSWKVSGGTNITICNRSVDISVSGYTRRLINPSHYCGISFPNERSPSQNADHMALAWKLFLGDIFTHKRKGT